MGTATPAVRVSDPKGIENERRICVHYLWTGVTILNLLFPISPFFAFGYYRLATLGPRLDLFENNQEKKPRNEEESLRQELGKQEGEARKGEARGSPSLGRLCPESGNLSLASSGRLVLACALLQGLRFIIPKAFSELLKLSRKYQMLTVTKRLSVDAEPTSSVEQHNEYKLGSFCEPCFSFPPIPIPTVQNRPMEYSQVVRHRFLVPACKGSNPFTPDYEHPIGSIKNKLTTTREAADCSP
ncbi:hypothetical protein Salat_2581300 [Sesamum alatum]|uniref:Transmembrane protein n=1 Tax=Sesamum alatum TaxID=300844 RepID=A0AAE1XMV1_9LAMI|nr:hypothetical protein Salat_2581300 [Sesamum alatum]